MVLLSVELCASASVPPAWTVLPLTASELLISDRVVSESVAPGFTVVLPV